MSCHLNNVITNHILGATAALSVTAVTVVTSWATIATASIEIAYHTCPCYLTSSTVLSSMVKVKGECTSSDHTSLVTASFEVMRSLVQKCHVIWVLAFVVP
jgi:hypothetical protein